MVRRLNRYRNRYDLHKYSPRDLYYLASKYSINTNDFFDFIGNTYIFKDNSKKELLIEKLSEKYNPNTIDNHYQNIMIRIATLINISLTILNLVIVFLSCRK